MSEKADIAEIWNWLHSLSSASQLLGIEALQKYYLTYEFRPIYLDWVAELRTTDERVNHARAIFFSEAMVRYPEFVCMILENHRLDQWTHQKTLQKCRFSRRISAEQKEALSYFSWKEPKKEKTL